MLGNFEKRRFADGEKVWLGHYRNLTNVLHWHFECELIRITEGTAQIKIGSSSFDAAKGDVFFCAEEELHYIVSAPGSKVDIVIFERSITQDITDRCSLTTPKLSDSIPVDPYLQKLEQIVACRGPFYREALESFARALILEIFRSCSTTKQRSKSRFYNNLISKINDEFSFITFADAASYCGYSPSHFSKMFKTLSGMNFSDYLNILKVENAIDMLHANPNATITSVSAACGFSTIRNFNRVFKEITGYSPRSLPEDYLLDTSLHISGTKCFDPTQKTSELVQNMPRPSARSFTSPAETDTKKDPHPGYRKI